MSSVNPECRGVANGVRQTVQNAGWILSTALSLMIVTMSLPGPLEHAAYAGTICILGLIASLARARDQVSI